jgi:hypothetical protein
VVKNKINLYVKIFTVTNVIAESSMGTVINAQSFADSPYVQAVNRYILFFSVYIYV